MRAQVERPVGSAGCRPAYLPFLPYLPCLPSRSRWLLAAALLARKPPDERDYATKIAADRAAKDAAVLRAATIRFPKAQHAEFLPLAYFPIDPDYNVPGSAQADRRQDHLRDADVDRRQPARCGASARWSSRSRGSR